MAIVKWAPFSAFTSLEREMQSMLDRFAVAPATMDWRPTCDVFRSDGELIVKVELPGVDPDEGISVEVEDGMLHITGEKIEDVLLEEKDRYVRERRYGAYRRDLVLPEGVIAEDVVAAFDNGVLAITVPVPSLLVAEERPAAVTIDVTRPAKLEV